MHLRPGSILYRSVKILDRPLASRQREAHVWGERKPAAPGGVDRPERVERDRVSAASQLDATGRPLRDQRISVTDRSNFRCAYCMPGDVHGR